MGNGGCRMRIIPLDEGSRKNILEDLLKPIEFLKNIRDIEKKQRAYSLVGDTVKKKLYALFFITLFLFGAFSIRALKQEDFPLLGKVIYLDPGHGGTDPGAEYKDIYEKNINAICHPSECCSIHRMF